MYLPYLRGKQYELIAIRELIEKGLLSKRIIPVIEPVKLSPTLKKTVKAFVDSEHEMVLIGNPKVGSLTSNSQVVFDEFSTVFIDREVSYGYLLDEDVEKNVAHLTSNNLERDDIVLVHIDEDYHKQSKKVFEDCLPRFNLIPQGTYRRKVLGNKVLFIDRFKKQSKNSDYSKKTDEFFSDDHLYFKDENYIGFSDYSISGSAYSEGGFLPYAVAIHIVYFDSEKSLRIKHFVSDSNLDSSNTPKKCHEALKKLYEWSCKTGTETEGIKKLINHYESKTFPGLGALKKYSLMHHFELLSGYLDEEWI